MSRRLIVVAGLCVVACDRAPAPPPTAAAATPPARTSATVPPRPIPTAVAIDCAGGGSGFTRGCTAERVTTRDGAIVTVRDGSGGFRRLRVSADGRRVDAADGAVPATMRVAGASTIEVAVGDERFRLPARTEPATPR